MLSKLLTLTGASLASAAWTDICTSVNKCPTIMMDVACQNKNMCAIVGGFSDTPMSVYFSIDQFLTFTKADMIEDSLMLLALDIDSSGAGATAGFGALTTGILYSATPVAWIGSTVLTMLTGQDMQAFGNGEFGWVGQDGNDQGVLISTDKGKDWNKAMWPKEFSDLTQARYGAFPSDKVLYVTGGQWPPNNNTSPDCYPLREHMCFKNNNTRANALRHSQLASHPGSGNPQGYFAIITKSVDGGKTWEKQLTNTNFYFNGIHCWDVDTCTAIGEGFDDSAAPGGYVWMTTNGGKNWTNVFTSHAAGAGMMRPRMVSKTEAWAAGGDEKGGTFYHTVDGGKTWKEDGPQVPFVGEVMGLDFVDNTLGFAVGVTTLQTSVVMRWDGK